MDAVESGPAPPRVRKPLPTGTSWRSIDGASIVVIAGMIELTICALVLCSVLSTFTSGLQATAIYGLAAARLTALMLLFIGIKEKRHCLLLPHLIVQIFTALAFICPIWIGLSKPIDFSLIGGSFPMASATSDRPPGQSISSLRPHHHHDRDTTAERPALVSDFALFLCISALLFDLITLILITNSYVRFRRFNRNRTMKATEALLRSISNQWRRSSSMTNVSSCVVVESFQRMDTVKKETEERI